MSSKEKIELLKNRNISAIIIDTISFVRTNFKSLFSGLFYICTPALLVTAIGVFLFFNGYFGIITKTFSAANMGNTGSLNENIASDFIYLIPYALLMMVGIYFAMCFISSVSYSYVKLYRQDIEITTNTLWNTSKKYIWKIFGAQFILSLAIFVLYLVCCLPLLLFLGGNTLGAIGVFLMVILLLAFVIVCFYLYVKLAFHQHLIVSEDMGIMESFKASYRFSKGIFWKTFLSVFLLSLIVSICGNIFQIPGMMLMYFSMIMGMINQGDNYSVISLLGTALTSIGMIFAYMLYAVIYTGISFIYYSTVEERQGIKSSEEIESIGKREED